MARLKLSPSGLRSPLEVPTPPAEREPVAAVRRAPRPAPVAPTPLTVDEAIDADAGLPRVAVPVDDAPPAPAEAGPSIASAGTDADAAPDATASLEAGSDVAPSDAAIDAALPNDAGPEAATPAATAPATDAVAAPDAAATPPAVAPDGSTTAAADDAGDLPAWAAGLDPAALAPARLLGRPKQTALILDRGLSTRADALVAATGPRVTFAAIVTAVLHFHLPVDGEAAARTIGGYRRRRLDVLDHPWEERNARLPEPLRAELDDVVAGALGRVASVHRSTLVNALLDAHLPADADAASRLVTRMEMVRGGAFLDLLP